MTEQELRLLEDTLKSAIDGDHWLPQSHQENLRKCLRIVKSNLKITSNQPKPRAVRSGAEDIIE